MSGETEEQVSGWTVDTLHSHILAQLNLRDKLYAERDQAQKVAMSTALAAAKEAVAKAESAAEKRFDSQNEFRGQLADQAQTFLPRAEGEVRIQRNSERLDELVERMSQLEGRGAGNSEKAAVTRVISLAIATMAISLIAIIVAVIIAVV